MKCKAKQELRFPATKGGHMLATYPPPQYCPISNLSPPPNKCPLLISSYNHMLACCVKRYEIQLQENCQENGDRSDDRALKGCPNRLSKKQCGGRIIHSHAGKQFSSRSKFPQQCFQHRAAKMETYEEVSESSACFHVCPKLYI